MGCTNHLNALILVGGGSVPKAKSSTLLLQSLRYYWQSRQIFGVSSNKKFLHSAVTLIDDLIGVCRILPHDSGRIPITLKTPVCQANRRRKLVILPAERLITSTRVGLIPYRSLQCSP
jgi:hypothetical protein